MMIIPASGFSASEQSAIKSMASGGGISTAVGLLVTTQPFQQGGFSFSGGTVTLPGAGTWYVGVDFFSGELRALPRLGHRGWVPVAVCVATDTSATVTPMRPVVPDCRIPRTVKKLLSGQGLNVVVMGSSLAEGGGTTDWSGMLFNSASSLAAYRLPGSISFTNIALGGVPNQYQLAQLGFGSQYLAMDYSESGYPTTISGKTPPNGRSSLFTGVDLVVLTVLANGGDYYIGCIEPIVRRLRQLDIEVILTTDNAQGAAQVGGTGPYIWAGGLAAINTAGLYVDGPEVIRIADTYRCELADTAAYVAEAVLRYPAANIYRDSIHMYNSTPVSRVGQPGGGYEVYARAIRSIINIDAATIGTVVLTKDFNDGTVQGFVPYQLALVANVSNALVVTKNSASTVQWGGQLPLPSHKTGDVITVTGTYSQPIPYGSTPSVGVYNSGWGSNSVVLSSAGNFSVTLVAIKDNPSATLLFFGNLDAAADGSAFTVDNLVITVNSSYEGAAYEKVSRGYATQMVAPCRIVKDFKTPGDAFVILPKDEYHYSIASNAGTLGAHPGGAGSFARRFSSAVGASQDLLTLVTGQRAAISALGAVGFSAIYYSTNGDPAVTFDVYVNNSFQKTVTIPAQTITREIYLAITTPTQLARNDASPTNHTIDIRVTSGTLRICALVSLTADMDYLPPEAVSRIGTWTAKVPGGSPNMPGYATDTVNDYAVIQCPLTARRVAWLLSSKPNSKNIDTWSGRTLTADQASAGTNHVHTYGNHVGPGESHYIKLKQAQANTDQSTNGYGLHIGGVVLVNDR